MENVQEGAAHSKQLGNPLLVCAHQLKKVSLTTELSRFWKIFKRPPSFTSLVLDLFSLLLLYSCREILVS